MTQPLLCLLSPPSLCFCHLGLLGSLLFREDARRVPACLRNFTSANHFARNKFPLEIFRTHFPLPSGLEFKGVFSERIILACPPKMPTPYPHFTPSLSVRSNSSHYYAFCSFIFCLPMTEPFVCLIHCCICRTWTRVWHIVITQ